MVTFFVEGLKHVYQAGTVFPSSPWFARAMTQSVPRERSPKRILEVGPGTGGMTRLLLSSLNDGDEFHIVERNPVFAGISRLDCFIAFVPLIPISGSTCIAGRSNQRRFKDSSTSSSARCLSELSHRGWFG